MVIGALIVLDLRSEAGLWALFLSWPWWGEAGFVLAIVAVLGAGFLFEQSRRWPRG